MGPRPPRPTPPRTPADLQPAGTGADHTGDATDPGAAQAVSDAAATSARGAADGPVAAPFVVASRSTVPVPGAALVSLRVR
jgi:hypothetical protein